MHDYAIISPAKNEEENVPRLVRTMAAQTLPPKIWILVDDSCTDQTVEMFRRELDKYPVFTSACTTLVTKHQDDESGYSLGEKYSRVVKAGLNYLADLEGSTGRKVEHIGVLDCDVFPEARYYEKIATEFGRDARLGIAAGGTQNEEYDGRVQLHRTNRNHAPGGLRVWRKECLTSTGYDATVSQDAVSQARAIMLGWRVRSFPDITVYMRKRGAKFGYAYYGKSAYIRWVPRWYVILGATKLMLKGRTKDASAYWRGYLEAKRSRASRIKDPVAKRYFRYRIFYKVLGK